MRLLSAAKVSAQNSPIESAIRRNENEKGASRAKLRQLLTAFSPARTIAFRKRVAARTDNSAVTGPWIAEYGPRIAGKKKIESTLRRTIPASAPSIRPEIIER